MELTGEQFLPLPRERVWAALNDPEILRASVPGCESLERVEDNHFKVVMAATVGPIKARFNGKLTLTDLVAPESYSLTFEGSGGAAGFGKGGAQVGLASEGDGTRLTYRAHAQVGGRLAQVGARLIDGVAKKMAADFFGHFTHALTGSQQGEASRADAAQPGAQAADAAPAGAAAAQSTMRSAAPAVAHAKPSGSGRTWLWAVALVVVVAAFAAYRMH
ncbi:MAG TPA: carbon monoxide dehydrogenase subunit G [Paraburkholderia sp.]|jgi:carbon monoxide dehydrogenase subunit G|nr:carbon monoxide dehydrogenase subunit G [Paraburkholderia sp.]